MSFDVRPGQTFSRALQAIPSSDFLRILDEASQICFRLVEEGPNLPEARPMMWPVGEVVTMGRAIDLRSGDGYILYFAPEELGHDYIYVADLEMYDERAR